MFGSSKSSAPQSLAELDAMGASVDAMRETDTANGGKTSKATLKAGQAAVDRINASKERRK